MTRNTAEWLELRRSYITGSDLATILGVHPYISKKKLLLDKLGLTEHAPVNAYGEELKLLGIYNEPLARNHFNRAETEFKEFSRTVPDLIIENQSGLPLAGTPDYLLQDGKQKVVVEFKCRFYPNIQEATPFGIEALPMKDWLQLQHYLYICKADLGILYYWTYINGTAIYKFMPVADYELIFFPAIESFLAVIKECKTANEFELMDIINHQRTKTEDKKYFTSLIRDLIKKTNVCF